MDWLYRKLMFGVYVLRIIFKKCIFKCLLYFPEAVVKMQGNVMRKFGVHTLDRDVAIAWARGSSIITWRAVRDEVSVYYLNHFKTTKLGSSPPNTAIHKLDGTSAYLMDYCNKTRPFIVIFGSST